MLKDYLCSLRTNVEVSSQRKLKVLPNNYRLYILLEVTTYLYINRYKTEKTAVIQSKEVSCKSFYNT